MYMCEKKPTKETYKRDLQKRPTTHITLAKHYAHTRDPQKRRTCVKRDLQKQLTKETYKRDLQKRPTKETYNTYYASESVDLSDRSFFCIYNVSLSCRSLLTCSGFLS